MNSKAILYDLGVSLGAVTLWFTPYDLSRALGYTASLIFSGRAYYAGITLLSNERKTDEKEAIAYEAETDFYDQLLGTNIDAALEVKALEVENRMLERMIPLMAQKTELEKQLHRVRPMHPEMTEDEKEQAAREVIEDAFVGTDSKNNHTSKISEEDIRKQFPEEIDSASWKAILKALQNGSSKAEIIKDVFGCNQANEALGKAYFEYLKSKFLL
jgi:dsDNA-binding SOS-regulon protein